MTGEASTRVKQLPRRLCAAFNQPTVYTQQPGSHLGLRIPKLRQDSSVILCAACVRSILCQCRVCANRLCNWTAIALTQGQDGEE